MSKNINYLFLIVFMAFFYTCNSNKKINIEGELKKLHRITLSFEGPETSELAEENPFLNYRLDVTFTNGEEEFVIPGFYATDGNAAETSSDKGNIWQVRFTPNKTGEWSYIASFKTGENIAVADGIKIGKSAGFFDGAKGSFLVKESDKKGNDNRAKGKLAYVGESYLKFTETAKYFIKLGVDAPENLLAYTDIDVSTNALGLQKI